VGAGANIDGFLKKLAAAGESTERNTRTTVNLGALEAKTLMQAAAGSAGLTSGSKIAGRKWGVRYDVRGSAGDQSALVRYTGPIHLVHNPTAPHYIAAKGLGGSRSARLDRAFQASASRFMGDSTAGAFGGQRRTRGKKALSINGQARAYARHPGTKGKPFFKAAKRIAEKRVPEVMADRMKDDWKRIFS
jgi:hypothetical protein